MAFLWVRGALIMLICLQMQNIRADEVLDKGELVFAHIVS